jgi:hypothetical protein
MEKNNGGKNQLSYGRGKNNEKKIKIKKQTNKRILTQVEKIHRKETNIHHKKKYIKKKQEIKNRDRNK